MELKTFGLVVAPYDPSRPWLAFVMRKYTQTSYDMSKFILIVDVQQKTLFLIHSYN